MNRILRLAALTAALSIPASTAFAAPVLRSSVTVTGDVVLLGDLISDAGSASSTAVFRAPDLGSTGQVSVDDILDAARRKGLGDIDAKGLASVSVTHASRRLETVDVTTLVSTSLAERAGLSDAEAVSIDLDEPGGIHLPVSAVGTPAVVDATWQREGGFFEAVLATARADGGFERTTVRGRAIETATIVVARRAVARGTVVTAPDVNLVRRPKVDVQGDVMTDDTVVMGLEAKRALRDGQIVRGSDLTPPQFVKRASTVTIIHRVGNLMLTATGQALRDGTAGETIQVLNTQSKRILQAVVTGPDQVSVAGSTTLASAVR